MNKQRTAVAQSLVALRPGEGVLVDVESTSNVSPSGVTSHTFKLDMGKAPVPERSYSADVYAVLREAGAMKLLFAQTKVTSATEVRSLLVIRIGNSAIARWVDSMTERHRPPRPSRSVEDTMRAVGMVPASPFKFVEEPSQTVCMTANFVVTAVSEGDACMDFLQASAFALDAMSHHQKLAMQAIVRVDLGAPLVLGLLTELKGDRKSVV